MNSKVLDRLLQLTDEAMTAFSAKEPLSIVIFTCIRIARLRGDWDNLWWLEMELCSFDGTEVDELKRRLIAEMGPHAKRPKLEKTLKESVDGYISERTVAALTDSGAVRKGEDVVAGMSVPVMERNLESLDRISGDLTVPEGLHPVDL